VRLSILQQAKAKTRLKKGNRRRASGFTLVEILIVISVVALLSALLLSVFTRVREKSRMATCSGNLRQIGLGLRLYLQDYRGIYPDVTFPPAPIDKCGWPDRMITYVKSPQVFWCPSFLEGEYRPGCAPSEEGGRLPFDGSYAANAKISQLNEARIPNPSDTITVLDGKGKWVNPISDPITEPQDLIARGIELRHNGGNNCLFADGHVKWLRLESMASEELWRVNR
jgi:prepilin-type processing-associated H-X9-DG protein/prepilin-type N-terminal cleavage/methylation domain-containing protein